MSCKNHVKPNGMPEIFYPYEDYIQDIGILREKILALEKERGQKFEMIYPIPRGGLVPAVHLSNLLDIEICKLGDLEIHKINPINWKNKELIKKILVIEDVVHSGKSILDYKEAGFFVTALLFDKATSKVEPDVWSREKIKDYWYIPFWETLPMKGGAECRS